MRRAYTYSLDSTVLGANAVNVPIGIRIHRPFVLRKITNAVTPTGRYRINIWNERVDFRYFVVRVRDDLVVGNGQGRCYLYEGYVFNAGDRMVVELADDSGSDNTVKIDFHGYEIVDEKVTVPEPGWAPRGFLLELSGANALGSEATVEGGVNASLTVTEDTRFRAMTLSQTGAFELNAYIQQYQMWLFDSMVRSQDFLGTTTDPVYFSDITVPGGGAYGKDLVFRLTDVSVASNTILGFIYGVSRIQNRVKGGVPWWETV